jgi:hypothetical protein
MPTHAGLDKIIAQGCAAVSEESSYRYVVAQSETVNKLGALVTAVGTRFLHASTWDLSLSQTLVSGAVSETPHVEGQCKWHALYTLHGKSVV